MLDLLLKGYHTQWHATGRNQIVTMLLQGCSTLATTLLQPVECYKVASYMVALICTRHVFFMTLCKHTLQCLLTTIYRGGKY